MAGETETEIQDSVGPPVPTISAETGTQTETEGQYKAGRLVLTDSAEIGTQTGTETERERQDMSPERESGEEQRSRREPAPGPGETGSVQTEAPVPDVSESGREDSGTRACDDEETARKGREEGRVDVVFPGSVTLDGCCRFVCELLKCVLYQRQQLPMTYDQMVFFQKQQHTSGRSEEAEVKKPAKACGGLPWRRCQRTLQDLDEVLSNLEALFSLSHVPRVLFMLGGSAVLPAELYEVNMEAVAVRGGEKCLRTSWCLRQLFRALFVADLLSDVKPVRLVSTTVMALAHRDCGVAWFKPKVDFKVPTKVKRRVVSLSCDAALSGGAPVAAADWDDYIWFQAPVAVKGFST
ncbi:MAD2L1-binding protein [Hoplias malabaricus]|uniref:MAD2L1-binding protein n=1 Tax=Hoplias malabaricus TaxID=27720 RepID=UPI0034622729